MTRETKPKPAGPQHTSSQQTPASGSAASQHTPQNANTRGNGAQKLKQKKQ